jgi:hypothetical protein
MQRESRGKMERRGRGFIAAVMCRMGQGVTRIEEGRKCAVSDLVMAEISAGGG